MIISQQFSTQGSTVTPGIQRRMFLTGVAAFGATPALLSLLTACSSTNGASTSSVMKIGSSANFEDFDPLHVPQGNFAFFNQIYGSLVRDTGQAVENDVTPWLATKIAQDSGGEFVDIDLRSGVVYHDGAEFNSDAVVANLKKVIDPIDGRDLYPLWGPLIKDWKVLGDHKIRLNFTGPLPEPLLAVLLGDWYLSSPKLIAKGQKAFLTEASGTGAYQLANYKSGVSTTLKRFPKYWRKTTGTFTELEYEVFQSPAAMVNALHAGTVDMAYYVPVQDVNTLKSDFTIITSPPAFTYEVILNAKADRPFANIETRQAMQYLVPRQKFVDNALFGLGVPTCVHPTKGSVGWSESLSNAFQYDPERAKETFKKFNMLGKDPIEIVQLTGILPGIAALAEITAAEMNAIGLNAKLIPVDVAGWADRFFGAHAGDYDVMCSFMGRANRYPTQWAGTNAALKPVDNPSWGGGPTPKDYSTAYNELLHAVGPDAQEEWATKLIQAGLTQSWDIAVANFGLQYALKKELTGVVDSRDDFIILEDARSNKQP